MYEKYKIIDRNEDDDGAVTSYTIEGKIDPNDFICPNCKNTKFTILDFDDGDTYFCTNHDFYLTTTFEKSNYIPTITPTTQSHTPKCPTCGSTNCRPITTTKRMFGLFTAGLASENMGKSYECLNCKYKW